MLITYIWIGLGSALGGVTRCLLANFVAQRFGATFPLGTLLVNLSGCFVIGLFAEMTGIDGRLLVAPTFRQFFMRGVCGGYTTFSSFSLETLELARGGEWGWAALNSAASLLGCLLAVALGHGVALWIDRRW